MEKPLKYFNYILLIYCAYMRLPQYVQPTFGVFYVGSKYSCRSRILERKLIP